MKLLSIIIGLALLVSASPSYAGGIVMMGGGVAAVGGDTEPASGTVIIGTSTTSTAASANLATAQQWFWNVDFAATWSETASTTTVGTIEWYGQGWAGGNCKALLFNSDGTIVTNGVSGATVIEYEEAATWHSFTMGTPPTVTKSTNYKIGIVCDTDYAINLTYDDTGSQSLGYEGTGNYTSPTAVTVPPDSLIDDSATVGGVRAKH